MSTLVKNILGSSRNEEVIDFWESDLYARFQYYKSGWKTMRCPGHMYLKVIYDEDAQANFVKGFAQFDASTPVSLTTSSVGFYVGNSVYLTTDESGNKNVTFPTFIRGPLIAEVNASPYYFYITSAAQTTALDYSTGSVSFSGSHPILRISGPSSIEVS